VLDLTFESEVIYWRGPAPFYFLRIPNADAQAIDQIAKQATYGWGVIPCDVTIGKVDFYTALFPKDGSYLLPLKKAVREPLKIELGDIVLAEIRINPSIKI